MGKNLFRFQPGRHGFACVLALGLCVAATDSAVATTLNGVTNYWRFDGTVQVEVGGTPRSVFADTASAYQGFALTPGSNRNFLAIISGGAVGDGVTAESTLPNQPAARLVAQSSTSRAYKTATNSTLPTDFTIGYWISQPGPAGNNGWSYQIMSSDNRSAPDGRVWVQWNTNGNWVQSAGVQGGAQGNPGITQSAWNFVMITADSQALNPSSGTGIMRMYVNGVEQTSLWRGYANFNPANEVPWSLGNPTDLTRGGSGRYAELAIWNRALTAEEVLLAYNRQSTTGSYGFVAVPEPATPGLLAIGGIAAAAVSCIRRRR